MSRPLRCSWRNSWRILRLVQTIWAGHTITIWLSNTRIMHGIINFDKPPRMSSALAVRRVKRLLPPGTKIGHAGTLDPFATGVLLLLVGKATKFCESLMDEPKQYLTTVALGATTETDDPESPQKTVENLIEPSEAEVRVAIERMVGTISQRPPRYSAVKIGGRRAYDLARRGKPVDPQPRDV